MPSKIYSVHDDYRDEFSYPQFSVWEDGSVYIALDENFRFRGGPMFEETEAPQPAEAEGEEDEAGEGEQAPEGDQEAEDGEEE